MKKENSYRNGTWVKELIGNEAMVELEDEDGLTELPGVITNLELLGNNGPYKVYGVTIKPEIELEDEDDTELKVLLRAESDISQSMALMNWSGDSTGPFSEYFVTSINGEICFTFQGNIRIDGNPVEQEMGNFLDPLYGGQGPALDL